MGQAIGALLGLVFILSIGFHVVTQEKERTRFAYEGRMIECNNAGLEWSGGKCLAP